MSRSTHRVEGAIKRGEFGVATVTSKVSVEKQNNVVCVIASYDHKY